MVSFLPEKNFLKGYLPNWFHEKILMDHCVKFQRVYVVVEKGHIYSCGICYWKIAGSGDFLKVRANCLWKDCDKSHHFLRENSCNSISCHRELFNYYSYYSKWKKHSQSTEESEILRETTLRFSQNYGWNELLTYYLKNDEQKRETKTTIVCFVCPHFSILWILPPLSAMCVTLTQQGKWHKMSKASGSFENV